MYLINLVFSVIIVIFALWAYFYNLRKTGKRLAFWPMIGSGWAVFAITHGAQLSAFLTDVFTLALLRIIGYVLVILALITLVIESKASSKPEYRWIQD